MDAPSSPLSIAPSRAWHTAMDAEDELLAAQFRLSVDSDGSDASPASSAPLARALSLPALDAADASLWNLISPCSDASEPPFDDDEEEEDRPEPEASPRHAPLDAKPVVRDEEEDGARYASSSDSEDEEVEVFSADRAFHATEQDEQDETTRRSSVGSDKPKDDALDSVTEGDECFDELDVLSSSASSSSQLLVEDSDDAHSSTASRWVGRVKARTYSGPASLHSAYDKLRSATATLRHTVSSGSGLSASGTHDQDDGGFSSDDEDYDHERASRVPTPTTRATSLSFPTRLSAVKNLQGLHLPTKMASMMRFRSSSSATTSSEDSFIGSHGGFADTAHGDETPTTSSSMPTSGLAYNRQELKHKATACATRAAGLLGAASAEAARKLRTTRAFRASSQPSTSSTSMAATSPIVDRDENSPGLPPLPARAKAWSAATASS